MGRLADKQRKRGIGQEMTDITNMITPEEYTGLRKAVGFREIPVEEAAEGLKHSYVVCIRDHEKAVAVGRILWDHGYAALLTDVIVDPEYQGRGLGRQIVETCIEYVKEQLKPGYSIMISLLAANGKEGFYKKMGFVERPNETFGPGLHKWLEK